MKILSKIVLKSLLQNKRRTIVTIIGITLAVALITAISSVFISLFNSLKQAEKKYMGYFHYVFYNVPYKNINDFKVNEYINHISIVKPNGELTLRNELLDKEINANIFSISSNSFENMAIILEDGRLPQNENEIIIPTSLKAIGNINYKIGDTITNGYNEYQIVGKTSNVTQMLCEEENECYPLITVLNFINSEDNYDLYLTYNDTGLKNKNDVTASLLGVSSTLLEKVITNTQNDREITEYNEKSKYEFLETELVEFEEGTLGEMNALMYLLCLIILIVAIYCIKNSFDISISEKTKLYGILISIGATKKQIKKSVFLEATFLGIIGIPLGLLVGYGLTYLFINLTNNIMYEMLKLDGITFIFTFSIKSVIIASIIGIITVYFSSFKGAKRATKVSPITSITNNESLKISQKDLNTPKIIKDVLGIGGVMAYKNIKRNKKKYRSTIVSLATSSIIFLTATGYIRDISQNLEYNIQTREYNISFSLENNNPLVYEKALDTVNLEGIEKYAIINETEITLTNTKYTSNFQKAVGNNITNEKFQKIYLISLDDISYEKYINSLSLNKNDIQGILVNKTTLRSENDLYIKIEEFDYKVHDVLSFNNDNENLAIEIGAITDKTPWGLKNFDNAILVINNSLFDELIKNFKTSVLIKGTNAFDLQNKISKSLETYGITVLNSEETDKFMNNTLTILKSFMYSILGIIILIGLTNIFNTITTSMSLRQREFAILKSIGMTNKEFRRFILLESVFIGIKALLWGLPIGVILSYLVHKLYWNNGIIVFRFPLSAILTVIFVVMVLIFVIMQYSIHKLYKMNTIETIRNENI